jgi:hypothetical protein
LIVLVNSLELVLNNSKSDILPDYMQQSSRMLSVYWRHMLEFLLKRLSDFRELPESAALSAKCIRLLTSVAVQSKNVCFDELRYACKLLPPLLRDAFEYGKIYNSMLEKETSILLQDIGQRPLQPCSMNKNKTT